MNEIKSILLAGVGGQGTILVSKILTQGLLDSGYDVKMSEVHGMSQRGGSVSTQVRYGGKVYSPIVGLGGADILVAFEKLEAARYSSYLKPGGIVVVNTHEIPPMPVSSGVKTYPEGILEALEKVFVTIPVDAAAVASRVGNPRTMNLVLFGTMVKALGMSDIDWEAVIRRQVPEHLAEVNIAAFREGLSLA